MDAGVLAARPVGPLAQLLLAAMAEVGPIIATADSMCPEFMYVGNTKRGPIWIR
jgi:hypothetical protein